MAWMTLLQLDHGFYGICDLLNAAASIISYCAFDFHDSASAPILNHNYELICYILFHKYLLDIRSSLLRSYLSRRLMFSDIQHPRSTLSQIPFQPQKMLSENIKRRDFDILITKIWKERHHKLKKKNQAQLVPEECFCLLIRRKHRTLKSEPRVPSMYLLLRSREDQALDWSSKDQ